MLTGQFHFDAVAVETAVRFTDEARSIVFEAKRQLTKGTGDKRAADTVLFM